MKFSSVTTLLALGLGALLAAPAMADDTFCAQAQEPSVTTAHTTVINNGTVEYSATAGYLHVVSADGNSHACVFYTSYKRTDVPATTVRPLAFAFNGGPGSASLWLHLGALGPERIDLGPQGLTPAQPFALSDNQNSFLDIMDLVLIDPVATSFSTVDPGSSSDAFFGVKNDYVSIANFVQTFLTQNDRWSSPKLIIGESYGGIRAALLTNYLQRSLGINIAGIIYISPWLDSGTTTFDDPDSDLGYISFLPTLATSAWYHSKLGATYAGKTLQDVREAAEDFAFGDYLEAMALGNDLPAAKSADIAQRLADLTGFSVDYINQHNLRLTDEDQYSDLLADQHLIVGRYDSRFTEGATGDPQQDRIDPADQALTPPFTAAMNDYLINQLDWKSDNPYVAMGNVGDWPTGSDGTDFSVMDQLSAALLDNPQLQVYVAMGAYDFAVPFGATEYNFRHLAPGQNLIDRVTFGFYESGHMVYTNPSCLVQLKGDVTAFVTKTLAPAPAPAPAAH